ncbi:hypothetical protein ACA910_008572 [Epithemia clementina (nom. ined.)]
MVGVNASVQTETAHAHHDTHHVGGESTTINHESGVPVIDLSRDDDDETLIQEIAQACQSPGFFQVINHGIPQLLLNSFRDQCKLYFALDEKLKQMWKRQADNARGFFDDELTKQVRDWKECLDVGVPGSRDWLLDDDDPRNACLDGFNRFPFTDILPGYRSVTVKYFSACEALSKRLAGLMARGLGVPCDDPFIMDMAANHSSYLRTNYYPPFEAHTDSDAGPWPLGISPHKDAGFLTVLLQDDDCHLLQVPCHGIHGRWMLVRPIPGALTINTGDMAQVWSNGKYQAPLHRVLTDSVKPRYSAPFFYNPPYHATVEPATSFTENRKYHPVLWAYYRAMRFAGDMTDLGVEIQIEDFEIGQPKPSHHLKSQKAFLHHGFAHLPFDVERCRSIL